jgi:hypothetical protein
MFMPNALVVIDEDRKIPWEYNVYLYVDVYVRERERDFASYSLHSSLSSNLPQPHTARQAAFHRQR